MTLDDNSPKKIEWKYRRGDSPYLYVFFSSRNTASDRFDYDRLASHRGIEYICFKDPFNRWYVDYIDEVPKIINKNNRKNKQLVFVGSSMGGYAAILFSSYFNNIARVITFSPQTISMESEISLDILTTYKKKHPIKVYIPMGETIWKEHWHAGRLKNIEGVSVTITNANGHGVARWFSHMNKLENILFDF